MCYIVVKGVSYVYRVLVCWKGSFEDNLMWIFLWRNLSFNEV